MARKVLSSKLVSERILVEFDFLDQLDWGETIESATVVIVPEIGEDALPQEMLYKVPVVVAGRFVRQQFFRGTPGVIYQLKCSAFSSRLSYYEAFARLAILPDSAQIPLFNATYLTSRPYPVEDTEGISVARELIFGSLSNQLISDLEAISASLDILQGTLVGGRSAFTAPTEAITVGMELPPLSI